MQNRVKRHRRSRLLAVFAHPDDETFCAGGTLAKYVAAGWEVVVVSATRGQAGQIRDSLAATRRTLGQVREREFYAACEQLGIHHARVLDYMDGTLQDVEQHELTGAVVKIIRASRPDVVITFGPDGAYGHPDHIAIGAATTRAFEQAGSPQHFPEQLAAGRRPHRPAQLYHSYFPQSRLLLRDHLAHWLATSTARFQGTAEFTRALPLFAEEAITLRYASDHVDVEWFPSDSHIVEQNEPGAKLYLILSGYTDVIQEAADGTQRTLARLGPGEFFGELAIVHQQPRAAHVVAVGDVTCLVLAPGAPSAFAGRGADAQLSEASAADGMVEERPSGTLVSIDVSAHVAQKIAAVAAHRTQYPITPDMLPRELLQELFGTEYFVRVHPSRVPETSIWPEAFFQRKFARSATICAALDTHGDTRCRARIGSRLASCQGLPAPVFAGAVELFTWLAHAGGQ
jgi:LmbE family N-acetylglucosaminyl deacetylase